MIKLTENQEAIAEQVKKYLANSYDYDITEFRCPKSGRVTRKLADDELVAIYELVGQDLVKLAERLELLHSYSHVSFAWLVEDDTTLDKLRYSQPMEFFIYATSQLVDVNKYYCQYRKRSNGMLTTEGRYQLNADFAIYCEQLELALADQPSLLTDDSLAELNEKLLLMLSIGATSKLENLIGEELSFDWLVSKLISGNLLPLLNKLLNQIINDYKIKHGIAFSQELSYQDVQRLSRQARQQALAESKAKQEWIAKLQATKASYHQKVKTSRSGYKVTQVTSLMENLISELSLANNDKQDYLNKLVKQQANNLADGKSVAKLQQLARQATSQATDQPTIKTVKLNFKLAMPTAQTNSSSED
jgi:hypothetical protein